VREAKLKISVLPEVFMVCRLDKDAEIPDWAWADEFVSITKTPEELSIVCRQFDVPKNAKCEKGWRCLKVNGPLDFSCVGVLASLSMPLAKAGVSIFAVSTYDTDYLLVKEKDLERAICVLSHEGHIIER
jgi:hypothetical protein